MKAPTIYASLIGLAHVTFGQLKILPRFPGSVTSSGDGKLDLFIADGNGNVLHKYHTDSKTGWSKGFEHMNISVPTNRFGPYSWPIAVTLGKDQTHVFVNTYGELAHRYWDGSQWLPSEDWETLDLTLGDGNIAVTTRGSNRLHIVARDYDGKYGHKYYDGTAWKPDGNESLEDLGNDGFGDQYFESDPVVNSWGSDRLDIFGRLQNGTLLHKYWDGYQWQPSISAWEQWGSGFLGQPAVTSWGKDRLDVWVLNETSPRYPFGNIAHRYWDGHSLSAWENLEGFFDDGPSVTHWGPNRHDLFGPALSTTFYKYWNGSSWNPTPDDEEQAWFWHSSDEVRFTSKQLSTSWGKDNLHLFGLSDGGRLQWQKFEDSKWSPTNETYTDLGEVKASQSISQREQMERFMARMHRRGGKGRAASKHENGKANKHWSQLLVQDENSFDL